MCTRANLKFPDDMVLVSASTVVLLVCTTIPANNSRGDEVAGKLSGSWGLWVPRLSCDSFNSVLSNCRGSPHSTRETILLVGDD